MYRAAVVIVALAVAGAYAEERTILGDATSGLTNLLTSSSPSAPYPPAPEPYHPAPLPEYHSAPYPAAPYPPAPEPYHPAPIQEYHSAPYPAAPYPAPAPEHHHEEHAYQHSIEPYTSTWEDHHGHGQSGFTVQSGYEGLIVPEPLPEKSGFPGSILGGIGGLALAGTLLHKLLPFPLNKIALFLGTKIGIWVLGIGLLLLVGGAVTTGVCAFTPICTISFLGFPFLSRENARSLFTHDKINMATKFVHDAIDKYNKINARVGKAVQKINKAKKAKEQKQAKEAIEREMKGSAPAAKEGRALKTSEVPKPETVAKPEVTTKKET